MTTDEHKRITTEFFVRASAGDIDGVLALMSSEATWQLPGKPELNPSAGVYDQARIKRLFQRMLAALEAPLAMTVLGAVAEGDRVAVEVESSGDLKNGRKYRQEYHFLFTFHDGKIVSVREYLDTQHAFDVWIRP